MRGPGDAGRACECARHAASAESLEQQARLATPCDALVFGSRKCSPFCEKGASGEDELRPLARHRGLALAPCAAPASRWITARAVAKVSVRARAAVLGPRVPERTAAAGVAPNGAVVVVSERHAVGVAGLLGVVLAAVRTRSAGRLLRQRPRAMRASALAAG